MRRPASTARTAPAAASRTGLTNLQVVTPSPVGGSADILALQRLVGNQVVSRLVDQAGPPAGKPGSALPLPWALQRPGPLPVPSLRPLAGQPHASGATGIVHRKLPTNKTISGLTVTDDGPTLAALIKEYNKRESKLSPVERIEKLNAISRFVYAWYSAQDTKDLASLGGKDADAVRKLEESISKHHADAVEKLLKKAPKGAKTTDLDDLEGGEDATPRDRALLLLQEIASGAGPIRISGSGAFVKKAQSMLYRIMESPTGLSLLEAIAARGGTTRPVTIGEGEPPSELKGHLSDPSPNESKAIPQVTKVGEEEADNKEQAAKELSNMKKLDTVPDDDDAYGAVAAPGDIHAALMSGMKGIKFVNGATTDFYEWGPGAVGVYVALVSKKPGESTDNMNVGGKSVYTPEFVTLGHELGHALNILAGSSAMTCEELFAMFAGNVGTFEDRTDTGKNWTNAEEFATINLVENKIRQELGLEERGGHAAVVDQDLEDRMQGLKTRARETVGFVYTVEASFKGQKTEGKIEAIRKVLEQLGGLPVKGLSARQKRERCADYEKGIAAALKKLGALGNGVRVQAKGQWDGTFKALRDGLVLEAPTVVPSWL